MAIWTQREWRLVAAALPKDVDRPTPRQLDAAQRAALPADRWRTRQSMYGTDAAINIKLNIAAARAQTPDYDQILREAHAEQARVEAEQLAVLLRTDKAIQFKYAPRLAEEDRASPTVTPGNSSSGDAELPTLAHRRRIYAVGLIGAQAQRVRAELNKVWGELPGLDLVFVESDSVRKLVGLTGAYIVCTKFVDKTVHDVLVHRSKRCIFSHTANPHTMAAHIADLYGEAFLETAETELKLRPVRGTPSHRG